MNPVNQTQREIIPTATTPFEPNDQYGEVLEGLTWLKLNYDAATVRGYYLLRFAPGGRCLPHVQSAIEEFMVLEGDLEHNEGTVFKIGDFVRFYPGTEHFSVAPRGCLLLVVLNGKNQVLWRDVTNLAIRWGKERWEKLGSMNGLAVRE